jgi:monoterpene epsilon-lactone hydrolase
MMSEACEGFELPDVLRRAPIPATVSAAAAEALGRSARQPAEGDLPSQRAVCAGVQRELGAVQLARHGVAMTEDVIAGVPVRVFTPSQIEPHRRDAVLLNLHGGGFTKDAGSVTENAPLAALAGIKVVAARYRLAPEHPFPAAVDDAEAVYEALLAERPAGRIGLYGTSAGAILSAQLLVRLHRNGKPMPAALGFFSGSADLSRFGDTEHLFRRDAEDPQGGGVFSPYTGGRSTTDPEVSPLFGPLAAFPPTLCLAGTRDFMLSQTSILHRALLAAGVEAELVVYEAMLHAHWIYQDIPEAAEAFGHMAGFFRRRLG